METRIYIDKIKALRKLKHLIQQDMADRLGFNDAKDYSRIETGERRLTLELLESIAQVLEMTVVGLLSFDEKMVFNQCQQDHSVFGNGNHYHEANAAMVTELKDRIKFLEGTVVFLQEQLAAVRGKQ